MHPRRLRFAEAAGIPNSPLPALVYPAAFAGLAPEAVEARFAAHGWGGMWRDGIYAFHHFHSTAHEALAIAAGTVRVMLGGPGGAELELTTGDVVVLPAGTGHRNLGDARLLVIGAYPAGQVPDLLRGDPGELGAARARIAAVPPPATDPVLGAGGPLMGLWGAGMPPPRPPAGARAAPPAAGRPRTGTDGACSRSHPSSSSSWSP